MKPALYVLTLAALAVPFTPACTTVRTGPENEAAAKDASDKETSSIDVTGQGKATAKPDVLSIDVGVSVLRSSVSDAISTASRQADAVHDVLLAQGIDRKDIQTVDYSIAPEYTTKDDNQVLSGYRVTNLMRVRLRAIERAGEILDAVATAGGNETRIQNLQFTIDDPERLRDQAREEAWKDADRRAKQLAGLAGVRLGDPISIDETSGWVSPSPVYEMGFAEARATPIESGQLEVTVTVDVKFEIEEAKKKGR